MSAFDDFFGAPAPPAAAGPPPDPFASPAAGNPAAPPPEDPEDFFAAAPTPVPAGGPAPGVDLFLTAAPAAKATEATAEPASGGDGRGDFGAAFGAAAAANDAFPAFDAAPPPAPSAPSAAFSADPFGDADPFGGPTSTPGPGAAPSGFADFADFAADDTFGRTALTPPVAPAFGADFAADFGGGVDPFGNSAAGAPAPPSAAGDPFGDADPFAALPAAAPTAGATFGDAADFDFGPPPASEPSSGVLPAAAPTAGPTFTDTTDFDFGPPPPSEPSSGVPTAAAATTGAAFADATGFDFGDLPASEPSSGASPAVAPSTTGTAVVDAADFDFGPPPTSAAEPSSGAPSAADPFAFDAFPAPSAPADPLPPAGRPLPGVAGGGAGGAAEAAVGWEDGGAEDGAAGRRSPASGSSAGGGAEGAGAAEPPVDPAPPAAAPVEDLFPTADGEGPDATSTAGDDLFAASAFPAPSVTETPEDLFAPSASGAGHDAPPSGPTPTDRPGDDLFTPSAFPAPSVTSEAPDDLFSPSVSGIDRGDPHSSSGPAAGPDDNLFAAGPTTPTTAASAAPEADDLFSASPSPPPAAAPAAPLFPVASAASTEDPFALPEKAPGRPASDAASTGSSAAASEDAAPPPPPPPPAPAVPVGNGAVLAGDLLAQSTVQAVTQPATRTMDDSDTLSDAASGASGVQQVEANLEEARREVVDLKKQNSKLAEEVAGLRHELQRCHRLQVELLLLHGCILNSTCGFVGGASIASVVLYRFMRRFQLFCPDADQAFLQHVLLAFTHVTEENAANPKALAVVMSVVSGLIAQLIHQPNPVPQSRRQQKRPVSPAPGAAAAIPAAGQPVVGPVYGASLLTPYLQQKVANTVLETRKDSRGTASDWDICRLLVPGPAPDAPRAAAPNLDNEADAVERFGKDLLRIATLAYYFLTQHALQKIEANVGEELFGPVMDDGSSAMALIRPILETFDMVSAVCREAHVPRVTAGAILSQMVNHIDALIFNRVLRGGHYCSPTSALRVKMFVSSIESLLHQPSAPYGVDAGTARTFQHTRQACALLLLNKDIIRQPAIRHDVCPALSLHHVIHIIEAAERLDGSGACREVVRDLRGQLKEEPKKADALRLKLQQSTLTPRWDFALLPDYAFITPPAKFDIPALHFLWPQEQ